MGPWADLGTLRNLYPPSELLLPRSSDFPAASLPVIPYQSQSQSYSLGVS